MNDPDVWLQRRSSPDTIRQLVFLTIHTTETALTRDTPFVRAFASQLRQAAEGVGCVGLPQANDCEIALHVYGPDADVMFHALAPVVQSSPTVERAWALVRYGDVGAREVQITLDGARRVSEAAAPR
jgi:hypothetical protein